MVIEIRRRGKAEQAVDPGAAADDAVKTEVGDEVRLFEAVAEAGAVTSAELAQLTGISWQYVRAWLTCQAADGLLDYDEATGLYSLWSARARGPAGGHTFSGDAVRRLVS